MKCLTILEPWATLIVEGKKVVETRNWDTNYRGKILIHSSKTEMKNKEYFDYICQFVSPDNMPFHKGCIIGEAELVDIIPITNDFIKTVYGTNYIDFVTSEFQTCQFAWILDKPKIYKKPIPTRGSLGLWDYTGEIEEE